MWEFVCMKKGISHRNSPCPNLKSGLLGGKRGLCHTNEDGSKQIKEEEIQMEFDNAIFN